MISYTECALCAREGEGKMERLIFDALTVVVAATLALSVAATLIEFTVTRVVRAARRLRNMINNTEIEE